MITDRLKIDFFSLIRHYGIVLPDLLLLPLSRRHAAATAGQAAFGRRIFITYFHSFAGRASLAIIFFHYFAVLHIFARPARYCYCRHCDIFAIIFSSLIDVSFDTVIFFRRDD
jgi:hypothetical protein